VAVGEAALGDRPLDRHFALADVAPGEGVPPHEQQVENQDGQTEGIVVGRPTRGAERLA
jgi:hypothetical protein